MAVGLNSDSDYLSRTGGPASTGLVTYTLWCWVNRTSGVGYSAVTNGALISQEGNAGRYNSIKFDGRFDSGIEADPYLTISDAGSAVQFAALSQPPFDTWVFYVLTVSGTASVKTITVEWSALGSSTWHTQTHGAGGTENSITPANVLIGRVIVADANTCYGHYAYAGARAESMGETDRRALKTRTATASGDWAYWPLADNSDTLDTSGNSRTLTFNGTITTETSPDLGPPPPPPPPGPTPGPVLRATVRPTRSPRRNLTGRAWVR